MADIPFFVDGYIVKQKKVSFSILADENSLNSFLEQTEGNTILFSPLSSMAVEKYGLTDKTAFWIGTDTEAGKSFDITLKSNEMTAWKKAVQNKSFQMGLVYSPSVSDTAEIIKSVTDSAYLNIYPQSESGGTFYYAKTAESMKEDGVFQVLCPGIQEINEFFKEENGIQWIINYRYKNAVPENSTAGIIEPDFKLSLKNLIKDQQKNSGLEFPLYYRYREI